jgi:hypothetical protein
MAAFGLVLHTLAHLVGGLMVGNGSLRQGAERTDEQSH